MPLTENVEKDIIRIFQHSLNICSDVPSALENFSTAIQKEKSIPLDVGLLLSNSVDDFSELIRNRTYLAALRSTFNSVYDILSGNKENNEIDDRFFVDLGEVNFKIEGRRKGAINSVEKMLRLLREQRSLDLFRDSMGIRIILFGDETPELQAKAYQTMEAIIQFMINKHFKLCEADTIKQHELDEGLNILIPKNISVSPLFKNGVKDYVKTPKANGYQSLHAAFRARNGTFIEIQVRTEQMHLHSEYNDAKHCLYKTDKYGERLHSKIDFSKIHMPGFRYINKDMVYDDIGLQTSLLTFYRTKSF